MTPEERAALLEVRAHTQAMLESAQGIEAVADYVPDDLAAATTENRKRLEEAIVEIDLLLSED